MKKLFTLSTLFLASFALQAQWVQQNTGFTSVSRGIRDISIVSPTVAWAVAYDGSGAGANVQDYTRTSNGGTTWTAGTISAPGITGYNNSNISALDANTAWIAMYGAAGGGRLYHTSNGGTTWTQQNTTGYTDASSFLNVVHFFDAMNGITLGDPVGGWHEVYTTQDGGATWTRVPQANMPALLAADEYGVIDMFSTVGDTIWFGSVYGRVFKSTNKGLNWTAHATGFTGNSVTYAMDDVEFLNGNDGLVKNGASIRRTTDGGLTWTAVPSTGTVFTTDLGAVPGTPESYLTVGTTGSSYTQNAGTNWTTINTTQYNKVAFINPTTGWAGGFSQASGLGGIFKWNGPTLLPTNDLSISAINSPAATLCNTAGAALVCVVISNTGTIAESNFPISYTINGGTPVTVNYTGTILPGANASYCFSPPASFPAPGTYTLEATVQLPGDMDATNNATTKTVTSVAPPTISVSGGATVCAGQSASLSASGANTYIWQPGGLTGATITVSPTATTTYTVTGSTGTGCSATATATVTVSAGPAITTTVTPGTICVGQPADISASGAASYSWHSNGATTSMVTVSPTTTTSYVVTGTDAGGCTATSTATVNVSSGPAIVVSATPGSVCPGEPVSLSASGGATYSWHDAGQATNTISVNPTTTTTYSVTGTDATGCTGTGSAMVIVTSAPVIAVTSAQSTICNGQTTELTASGGTTFSWHDAGQTTGIISVSPTATTTYSVTAQTSGGCTGQGAITVTVNPTPTVLISGNPGLICEGSSIALTASGGTQYSWLPNTGPGIPGPILIISPTGTVTYTVYVTDGLGCTGTDTTTIQVTPAPPAPQVLSNSPVCVGDTLFLTAAGNFPAGTTFSWSTPGANSFQGQHPFLPNVTMADAGSIMVFASHSGCTSNSAGTISVAPLPDATILPPVITGNSFAFTAATSGLAGYSWSFPGGSPATANTQSATVTYPGAGSYTAILTTMSGASCTDSDTLNFTISGTNSALQNLVKLYPNPTSGQVQLDLRALAPEAATLQVINPLGQLARTTTVTTNGVYELNMADLAEGAYTIRIITKDGVLNKQVLLRK